MKAAPALAAGNVLIPKASEMNPLSALLLGSLAIETGVALSSYVKIRKISFTVVGKKIQVAATNSNLKRVTLELGGKSPVLVSEDVRLDEAVGEGSRFLAFNGQGCVLATRIYVHESIAEKYLEGLKARVEGYAASLGADPFEMSTMSSPLFRSRQKGTVMRFLERDKKEVKVVTGGNIWGVRGVLWSRRFSLSWLRGPRLCGKRCLGRWSLSIRLRLRRKCLGRRMILSMGSVRQFIRGIWIARWGLQGSWKQGP